MVAIIQLFGKYFAKMTTLIAWLYYYFVFRINQNIFHRSNDVRVPVKSAYIDEPIFIFKYYYFLLTIIHCNALKKCVLAFVLLYFKRMIKYQI
jgi:hypothetical protein